MSSVISAGLTATTALKFSADTSGSLQFQTNGSTAALTIDTSQRVGIGTGSPTRTLQVIGSIASTYSVANDIQINLSASTTATNIASTYGSTGSFVPLTFSTNSATQMTLDTSGNLGLGVTPSPTTGSGVKGFEIGGSGNGLLGNSANVWVTQNAYFGSGFKKAGSGYATMYNQSGGTHNWNVSTSGGGSANDTITFTQAMTLDNGGNLYLGGSTGGAGVMALTPAGNTSGSPYSVAYSSSNSSSYTFHSMYYTGLSQYQFYVDWGGTVHARSTSISSLSDQREKTNIKPLETGLNEVLALKPSRFDWIDGYKTNVAGFIAQEVQSILPDLIDDYKVSEEKESRLGLRTGDMIPTLVKAIQELNTLITAQAAEITALKAKVGI
jgi:hypothetical protein